MTKHRISELEDRPTEFTDSTENNPKGKKKMNRASGICVTITNYLAFVSSESQKDRRKSVRLKSIQRDNG